MKKYSDNEIQLLVEDSKKDLTKFSLLYDNYVDAIYRYISRRVSKKEIAEDITSQTFYDAMNNIHKYQNIGYPFSSWLYKIAHNNVLQHYRKTSGKATVDLEALGELKDKNPIHNPKEHAYHKESKANINYLLSLLRDQDKEIVQMKYLDELSNSEISEILGINPNNVGVMLHRALNKLQQLSKE